MAETLKAYYWLAKPGIVYGNALTVIAGAFFGAAVMGQLDLVHFLAVLVGTSLVIASACAVNNVIDRDIDRRMKRTQWRAMVTGAITPKAGLVYGTVLGILGFAVLIFLTNWLTVVLGAIAYVFYVVIYGIAKRASEHGTLVGTIPGALPPVAGYAAMTNHLDVAMAIIFVMLVFWQMVHFYAIAIYRRKDYKAAGVPVITVARGTRPALIQMVAYAAGFLVASLLLAYAGYTHWVYTIVMAIVGVWWLVDCIRAFRYKEGKALEGYAKRVFFESLFVNIAMCAMIAVGAYLP